MDKGELPATFGWRVRTDFQCKEGWSGGSVTTEERRGNAINQSSTDTVEATTGSEGKRETYRKQPWYGPPANCAHGSERIAQ